MRKHLAAIIPILLSILLSTDAVSDGEPSRSIRARLSDGTTTMLSPDRVPFGPGEIVDYDLKYEFVTLGKARLEVEKRMTYRERDCLLLISRGKTGKFGDSVYKVRDEIRSIMDLDEMHSLYYSKKLNEGNYRKSFKAVHYHEEGIARYEDGQEFEFVAGSQDILSALYLIRMYPLEVGMTLEIPVHDGQKNYPLRVIVLARESVKTKEGEVMCFKLEPRLESQGLFKSEGRMQVFLSDDERRVPVLLKAKAPVGAFTSEISSYRAGERLELDLR